MRVDKRSISTREDLTHSTKVLLYCATGHEYKIGRFIDCYGNESDLDINATHNGHSVIAYALEQVIELPTYSRKLLVKFLDRKGVDISGLNEYERTQYSDIVHHTPSRTNFRQDIINRVNIVTPPMSR